MKKRNRLTLIITIIFVAVASFFIYKSTQGVKNLSSDDFNIADTSLVTKVFLTDKSNNKVLLEKKAPGNWTVNNKFNASNDIIKILLKTMLRIEVKAPGG